MLSKLFLLCLPALIMGTPFNTHRHVHEHHDLERRATGSCAAHPTVYSVLLHYSSAASFCSQELGITSVTTVVSTTSTHVVGSTATVKSGTRISTGSTHTTASISTNTLSTTITTTSSIIGTTTTITSTITVTSLQSANLPACAVSSSTAIARRSATSTPTQLTRFNNQQISGGCSCLSLTTKQVTTTSVSVKTVSSVVTTTIPASISVTTPLTGVTSTRSVVVTSTVVITPLTAGTATTTVFSTLTLTGSGTVSTPTAFYLRSSLGTYVSLASISGGAFYLNKTSIVGADLFQFNSANELVVITNGSRYNGFITVGTPPGYAAYEDWFPLEAKKSGSDGHRPPLCCGMTGSQLLTCGNGEIFGDCLSEGVWEGPAAAATQDYYYQGYYCSGVRLSVVTS